MVNVTPRGKGLHAVGYLAVFDRAEQRLVFAPVGRGFSGHAEHHSDHRGACDPLHLRIVHHVSYPESRPFVTLSRRRPQST
jgi:hypothetical protein